MCSNGVNAKKISAVSSTYNLFCNKSGNISLLISKSQMLSM